jgi:hypothetical protein
MRLGNLEPNIFPESACEISEKSLPVGDIRSLPPVLLFLCKTIFSLVKSKGIVLGGRGYHGTEILRTE